MKSCRAAVVHTSVPAKGTKEFIALAKANPGKYTFATPGTGSLGHANIENFMDLADISLLHIPCKGAGQAISDALAGQVDSMTDNLPSTLPHIKSGKLRPLAVLALKRSLVLPDVPTYTELGYPGMGDGGWFGLVAPAGTPKAVIQKLNDAAHKVMASADCIERMNAISGESMANMPAQFAKQIDAAIARYQGGRGQEGQYPHRLMDLPDFLQPRPDTPVEVRAPTAPALPLVCDSPHSGTAYPADFGHVVPLSLPR